MPRRPSKPAPAQDAANLAAPDPEEWEPLFEPDLPEDDTASPEEEPRPFERNRREIERFKAEMEALGREHFPGFPKHWLALGKVFDQAKRAFRRIARRGPLPPALREEVLIELLHDHRDEFGTYASESIPDQIPFVAKPSSGLPDIKIDLPSSPTLPKNPPERWAARDLNKQENPIQFLKRIYGPPEGFQLRQLRPIDIDLYRACSVWLHRHPEDRFEEPPSPRERMAKIIEQLSQQLSDDELRRLGYAIDARFRKK